MSWYCKKDVLTDIAHVTGSTVKELDEQYIVVGGQPPPIHTTDEVEDDEFLLRYGELKNKAPVRNEHFPDLAGITEMLRMVDKLQDPVYEQSDREENKYFNDAIITISKLNPNVSEFTPRSSLESGSSNLDKTSISDQDVDSSCSKNKYEKFKLSSEKLDSATLKEISDKLKRKISGPSETCLHRKTERNVAIATLLKLYSNKPVDIEITEKKLKLLTPEHFEKPRLKEGKSIVDSLKSSQVSMKQEDLENKADDTKDDNDKLIEESVIKVQNWFNREDKQAPKEPAFYLGPITFKKKENTKPVTPSSEISERIHKKVESFVPSEYANKLTETYMVRNKALDDQNGNIWTKLERELKAKDEIIKEKRKLQAEMLNNSLMD